MEQENLQIDRKFSIRDVAERAGVSIGTVSRVLNNKDNVNSEIYHKTREAIKSLNYKPLRISGNKTRRQTDNVNKGSIGVVFVGTDRSKHVYEDYLGAIDEVARDTGYHITVKHIQHSEILLLVDYLKKSKIGGVLLKCSSLDASDVEMLNRIVPVVGLDVHNHSYRIPRVAIDERQACHDVVELLCKYGHTNIAFFSYQSSHVKFFYRGSGYTEAMKLRGLFNPSFFIEKDIVNKEKADITVSDVSSIAEYIKQLNPRPTAVICANDYGAVALCNSLNKIDIRPGKDISIVGFGNILPLCEMFEPSLSSVSSPFSELAKQATKLLIQIINDDSHEQNQMIQLLPAKLIVRDSIFRLNPQNTQE